MLIGAAVVLVFLRGCSVVDGDALSVVDDALSVVDDALSVVDDALSVVDDALSVVDDDALSVVITMVVFVVFCAKLPTELAASRNRHNKMTLLHRVEDQ